MIVSNLSFYVITGYIGSFLNLAITFEYFFFTLIISYFFILIIGISREYHRGTDSFLKEIKFKEDKLMNEKKFSLRDFIKRRVSLNVILLSVFIILTCLLNVVNSKFFAGIDAWHHISIVKYITEIHYIPMDEYYGALGLHIFGAVINFFSGIDLILLSKYYAFYTIPLFSLIVYNIFMRIFKNKNLAIFGIFLLISSFGFSYFMLFQFWPSGITLIQGLVIFFILYTRLQSLTQEERPKKEIIFSNILFSYTLLTFIFISSFFTHSLITMILIFSYLWVYLIYFVKDYRRGFDFLILVLFFGIFLIFYYFKISIGHFQHFLLIKALPLYFLLFGTLVFILVITLIVLQYRRSLDFTKGIFRSILEGKIKKKYKKMEDKFIIPFLFGLTIIISFIFTLFTLFLFNIDITYIFYFSDMILISIFSIWGFLIFQYKPRGKPLFIWGLALDFFILAIFLFDAMIGITTFFLRVINVSLVMILIGFLSYLYKIIKINYFHKRKFKFFLIFIVLFSMFTSYSYDFATINHFDLKEREVRSIQWYSNYSSNGKIIISNFGWHGIFLYYDYPYEEKNQELSLTSLHYFFLIENQFLHPNLHISNDSNILKDWKSFHNTEVILVLPEDYYLPFSWRFFDSLNEGEIEAYYNLDYLNRIFSAKAVNGEEIPYYWVI
ncbi:MAG: hypothetical protein HWN81_10320 [Candidatus Lokiarchaeota archaeon]|nr:hypothetical protein [Candidatus Lokiarchaeota archaeon]